MGITRIANITGLDTIGIPTVLAVRPNSRSLSVSQGKGVDLNAAKASAVMESIEQYHAERVALPLRLGSYVDMSQRERMVDVTRLPRGGHPFDHNAGLLWTSASGLCTGQPQYVPYEMVHINLSLPLPPGSGFFPICTNGLASGNSLSEAIAHALWELIERDALALFYRRPAEAQWAGRLRLDSVDDPVCRSLLDRYHTNGIRVAVYNVTSDIGIAAFRAAIIEDRFDPLRPIGMACGFGAHNDRAVALCRALTEAAQSRLTRIAGSRDDIQQQDFEGIRSETAILAAQRQMAEVAVPPLSFHQVPHRRFATFREDVEHIAQSLDRVGMGEPLVVDLSNSELPISVVRVIVPGLEGVPDIPGYVPGERARMLPHGVAS